MDELKECGPEINRILRFGVDLPSAASTARSFLGSDTVRYTAIDGTLSADQELDLMVFYVGAFAYSGAVSFSENQVLVGDPAPTDAGLSVSAAIPLSEEDAANVFGQRRESGVEVDSERLPYAVMHLAEYYLAYKSIMGASGSRIVLLDRTLAGDTGHLVWSTRDLIRGHQSVLEGLQTSYGEVTAFDLEATRMLLPNKSLSVPAPRSQFLEFAAMLSLFSGEELSLGQIVELTGAQPGRTNRLAEDLVKFNETFGAFEQTAHGFKLKEGLDNYWERVFEASLSLAEHIFNPKDGHPLRVENRGKGRWVTADDLDFLVLVFIHALTRIAWRDNILLVGFIKDTNAFELVKAVVPLLQNAGLTGPRRELPNFNSDKMLLQTNSVVNSSQVPTPWHSVEMDAAFRTMAPVTDHTLSKGQARVNGAYGNVIYPERIFVKTYVQLWSSDITPSVRGHVFSIDRPAYPEFDHWNELVLFNRDGKVDEEIRPVLHFNKGSDMTNLLMAMLSEMGKEVIPEALGHNYPLFLADKKAKSVLDETRKAYIGAVKIEIAKSDLDQQVLFSRRFRDYRALIEGKRKN